MNINKHLYILTVIFLTYIVKTSAQTSIGLDAGITNNKLDFNPGNNNLKLVSRQGYIIDLKIDHKLGKSLIFEVSPGILEKNYSIKNSNDIYQNINNTYLHFPVSMKFDVKLISKLNISGSLGGYYAYWTKSRINGIAPNVFELTSGTDGEELIKTEIINADYDFTKQDNRSEFGWVAKIGVDYRIVNDIFCSIKGHYYQSVTDQQKQISELRSTRYNKTSALTVGISYSLK